MPRSVHDKVDLWFDGGWWEVAVVPGEAEPGCATVHDPNGTVRPAPLEDLRTSIIWSDGTWAQVPAQGEQAVQVPTC